MTHGLSYVLSSFPVSHRSTGLVHCPHRPVRHVLRRLPSRATPSMSGVNGGIDYEIDLSTLPPSLATRVSYIQQGPDSPTELIAAAEEIATSTPHHPQLLPVLVDMLGFNNPVAANIAVAALANAGSPAVPVLLTGVAAFNYAVNAYALRALGRIGDPTVIDVCVACATKGPIPNVRRAACRALGGLRFDDGDAAKQAFCSLVKLADGEPDWGVRYAAIVGLEHFETVGLVPHDVLSDGLDVVQAAAEGRSHVSAFAGKEEGDEDGSNASDDDTAKRKAGDPTVAARASVALEVMRERLQAADVVSLNSVLSSS